MNLINQFAARRSRRIASLLVLGAVLIALAVSYRHYYYARPIGSGPAGPAVNHEPFQRPWSQRRVVLLGLGDSVTDGLGASPGKSYFQRLVKNPGDEFPDMQGISLSRVLPKLEPVNLSMSGTTSIECIDYQLPKLSPYPEDVFGIVVITTGGNDLIHNYGRTPPREGAMYGAMRGEIDPWVEDFRQRMDTIISRCEATFPGGCRILITNIYDPSDGSGDIEMAGLPAWPDGLQVLSAWNQILAALPQRHSNVTLVDLRSEFLGHGVHCVQFWHAYYRRSDPHYWYWDNLEDPNDRGYDAIRRLFLNAIVQDVYPELIKSP